MLAGTRLSIFIPAAKMIAAAGPILPGAVVGTFAGAATVESIRPDGVHVVRPERWLLANGIAPTFFLQRAAIGSLPVDAPAKLSADPVLPEKIESGDNVAVFGQKTARSASKRERAVPRLWSKVRSPRRDSGSRVAAALTARARTPHAH